MDISDDTDLYTTLGVSYDASVKEIGRAYRIAALKCHPDKAGDDPVAAELFLKLTKAYDALSDPEKKASYDALLKGKLERKKKLDKLDAGRRKMATDLEKREFEARERKYTDAMEVARQKAEIERLREDGLAKIAKREEEARIKMEGVRKKAALDALQGMGNDPAGTTDLDRTLKLRWRVASPEEDANSTADKGSPEITEPVLRSLFAQFGLIAHLLVSLPKPEKKNKKASAIIQFAELGFAMDALEACLKGGTTWPKGLEAEWATGTEPKGAAAVRESRARKAENGRDRSVTPDRSHDIRDRDAPFGGFSAFAFNAPSNGMDEEYYEAATLRKMQERAAAREKERKRILEEDEREDEAKKKAKVDEATGDAKGEA
jgi:DnaJ family protein C protein 17